MIRTLEIKNFKSVKNVRLELSRVNLFIGPPNSGKSNIIESFALIRLLSSFSKHPNSRMGLNSIIRFRNYAELFYFYNYNIPIELTIDGKQIRYYLKNNTLHFTYENIDFQIFNSPVDELFFSSVESSSPIKNEQNKRVKFDFSKYNLKYYKFSKDQMLRYRTQLNLTSLADPFGENFEEVVFYNDKIHRLLNSTLGELGGYSLKRVVAPERMMLELVTQDDYVFAWEVASDGILKFIFDVAAMTSVQNSTVVLEEPEAGMFPYFINEICEIISKSNNQFVFSTHNPYFVDGILENVDKDEISIFFTKYNLKNKRTEVRCIKGEDIEEYTLKHLDLILASREVVP